MTFFERESMDSLPRIIRRLAGDMVEGGKLFLVHVEGTRSLACRRGVRNLAGSFLDMAIHAGAAVVPVRFAGGLPVEPLVERVEFPVDYGRQDYWLGRPILPEELSALHYKDRRAAIVDAINGLGPDLESEVPSPPDPEFAAEVEDWARRTGTDSEHATIYTALAKMERPGPEIERLLRGAREGVLEIGHGAAEDWLAELARRLFGPTGPRIRSPKTGTRSIAAPQTLRLQQSCAESLFLAAPGPRRSRG